VKYSTKNNNKEKVKRRKEKQTTKKKKKRTRDKVGVGTRPCGGNKKKQGRRKRKNKKKKKKKHKEKIKQRTKRKKKKKEKTKKKEGQGQTGGKKESQNMGKGQPRSGKYHPCPGKPLAQVDGFISKCTNQREDCSGGGHAVHETALIKGGHGKSGEERNMLRPRCSTNRELTATGEIGRNAMSGEKDLAWGLIMVIVGLRGKLLSGR